MMVRALVLSLALAGVAKAETDIVTAAEAAATALIEASESLEAASGRQDRVAALTETVRAYEKGLAAMREGLRRAALRRRTLEAAFDAESEELSELTGLLLSMQTSPEALLLLHPSGPVDTARAAMVIGDVTPVLQARVSELSVELQELSELSTLQERAQTTLHEGLQGIEAARLALTEAISDRTPLPPRAGADSATLQALVTSADTLDGFAASLADLGTTPQVPSGFAEVRGNLPYPVAGPLVRIFREADAAGVSRPGILIATHAQALVTAPWPATIRYDGPLLDYGNVIILEPEAGYLLVLAGLGSTFVVTGEVVQANAPLGLMPGNDGVVAQAEFETGSGQDRPETLYMELRQRGDPIDPASWFRGRTD
ncbi:MAG: peptidoglycan DD-metalloendopeptidase family protein [Pseudomonadota bacterium]